MKKLLITFALAFLFAIVFAQNTGNMLFPHIADVSHTTKAALIPNFFDNYIKINSKFQFYEYAHQRAQR